MINDILDTMDVPKARKDISKLENLKWLLRNVSIRNSENTRLPELMYLIKTAIKDIINHV